MPYFSSTIFVVSLVAAVLTALTGYFLFARALFPSFVDRTERAWTDRSFVSLLIGVPVVLVLSLVCGALFAAPAPVLRLAGFLLSGVSLGFVLSGTAGLAARIGRGLGSPSDQGREWARVLRGGMVLELTMLFPVLGWFLVAPIALIGGAGASTLALFKRKAAVSSSAPLPVAALEKSAP